MPFISYYTINSKEIQRKENSRDKEVKKLKRDLIVADVGEKLIQFVSDADQQQKHRSRLTLIAYQLSNLKLFKVDRLLGPVN